MERGALQPGRLDPGDRPLEDVAPIVVEAQHEAAVDLDAVVVQDRHPPRVVLRARGLLVRLDEVLARQRLEPDEDPRAARQRHLADQRRVVGHVDRHGGAPDHVQRPQGPAELPQVLRPGAEVVVDEDAVGLPVAAELGDDLLDVPDLVGHRQPVGRQVAEAATVVAAPRGDQAGRRQEAPTRQQVAARRRVVAVGTPVTPPVDRPERPRLDVAEDLRPELRPPRRSPGRRRAARPPRGTTGRAARPGPPSPRAGDTTPPARKPDRRTSGGP